MIVVRVFAMYALVLCIAAIIIAIFKGRFDAAAVLLPFLALGAAVVIGLQRRR